jgi:hypothetical protein
MLTKLNLNSGALTNPLTKPCSDKSQNGSDQAPAGHPWSAHHAATRWPDCVNLTSGNLTEWQPTVC